MRLVKRLIVLAILQAGGLFAQDLTGTWQGISRNPDTRDELRTVLKIASSEGNPIKANFWSIDQTYLVFPATLTVQGSVIKMNIPGIGAEYSAKMDRDAGTLRFEGYVKNGGGGGAFTFAPNPKFITEMRSLGFLVLADEKVFTMAVHDVSAAYVRELNALGIRTDSTDQLITMRIHGVTVDYVRDFKALGYPVSDLKPDTLVTMRIHGVTAEFARELKALRYNSVSPDQMVTMRIHGASTDFIKDVAALGYNHPGIDQLVTMRIHGVTPEFIRKTRSLGMRDVSIDQLVSLKIHGIVD
jgi:hypothetical protein